MALVVFSEVSTSGDTEGFAQASSPRELRDYDVVNVGAAGTFIVRKPGSQARFRAELVHKLPFEAEIVLCHGRDLIRLGADNPFGIEPPRPDIVRFVSILSKPGCGPAETPFTLPPKRRMFVRIIASKDQFIFGLYRRHMKTIGYLGQLDRLFGAPATTRNWNTILSIVRILEDQRTLADHY